MGRRRNQPVLGFSDAKKNDGPVECLGQTFENDDARREHFLALLAEKLKDPEFRKIPGFPLGADDSILRLSDPPYFTACPNPFLSEFVETHEQSRRQDKDYSREPFVADVSAAKTDHLYKSHRYHTKVPYKAIAQYLLHFTDPGDLILDAFCGTGMTGVAAEYVKSPDQAILGAVEAASQHDISPGSRTAILADLSPAATQLANCFNSEVDIDLFLDQANMLLEKIEKEYGHLFRITDPASQNEAIVTEYVWSQVFACPNCQHEIDFLVDVCAGGYKPQKTFECRGCSSGLKKAELVPLYESISDPLVNGVVKHPKRRLGRLHYLIGKEKGHRCPTSEEVSRIKPLGHIENPTSIPSMPLPYMHMTHERARLDLRGVTHFHHLFSPRIAEVISRLWSEVDAWTCRSLQAMGRFWIDSHFLNLSIQNCYRPSVSFPYNPMSGIYYVSSLISEANPFIAYRNKLKQLERGFRGRHRRDGGFAVSCSSATHVPLPDSSIDYVFTDPPFGENIYYSDLNFLVEAWSSVLTNSEPEAIVDRAKGKTAQDYKSLMQQAFREYYRTLKPGRWITVVFSNSKNHIWRAIQEALGRAGFVTADVRMLDKEQGSYRQVTSSAVKRDLVISAYKPTAKLSEQFVLGDSGVDMVWSFVSEHLGNLPVFLSMTGGAEVIAERTSQLLKDRMIAFFVQHGVAVPISGPDFLSGLHKRFPERDGMYFLPSQVAEYDRKRTAVGELRQLSLFVSDEASAIQWIRQQLHDKPQTLQDLQPPFMQQQSWSKHEKTVELKEILELNFLCYDGAGPVPSQIHRYLSTNFRAFRNLEKDDADLVAKATHRWYVPDPNKEGDLEKLRQRTLLKVFEEYRNSASRRIKPYRSEAVRAGFKHCYDTGDYQTIVDVAAKIPEQDIQEDEKLLMYYDVATMRLGM